MNDRDPNADNIVLVRPVSRGPLRLLWRTITKAWDDSIFGMAAQSAFWQTLSLPPLLLGLLGSIGYVGGWFGPDTIGIVQSKIITFSKTAFNPSVVDQIIAPTVSDILQRGRGDVVSFGFLLSLWAGSSAVSSFVDSIVVAHGQRNERHPVWQRVFALLLYATGLLLAVFTVPVVALGPGLVTHRLPADWQDTAATLIQSVYYPAVGLIVLVGLTTLYKFALPRPLPWHRLVAGALFAEVFFIIAAAILRVYFRWVTSTGYTYGALATPIAYLLFAFFIGLAVVIGAEFNAAIQEFWPAKATRLDQMRERMQSPDHNRESDPGTDPERAADATETDSTSSGPISAQFARLEARIANPRSLSYAQRSSPRLQSPSPRRRPS
ncbi:MAG: YihY/virulence factor BrkB family protein [Mycobacteriaceae bacterium]